MALERRAGPYRTHGQVLTGPLCHEVVEVGITPVPWCCCWGCTLVGRGGGELKTHAELRIVALLASQQPLFCHFLQLPF